MMTYRTNVMEYTKGRGSISFLPAGYAPCINPEEVIQKFAYQPESDLDNSPDSVFCSHGAGNLVKWTDVANYMHTESYLKSAPEIQPEQISRPVRQAYTGSIAQDEELMKIFEQTYGKIQHDERDKNHVLHTEKQVSHKAKPIPKGEEYLLVDGYNIIFSWENLKKISEESLDSARAELIQKLSNYQGMRQCRLIIVFDAYKVKGNTGSIEEINRNIHVVYTKEAETSDTYI